MSAESMRLGENNTTSFLNNNRKKNGMREATMYMHYRSRQVLQQLKRYFQKMLVLENTELHIR